MRAAIAIALCSTVAYAAPPTAHLVRKTTPLKEGDPTALFGRVAFVDNDGYLEIGDHVNDCRAEIMRVARVSSHSGWHEVVHFHGCKALLGDGVVVEVQKTLRRWSLDGNELPELVLPAASNVTQLVAANRGIVVAGGTVGGKLVLTAFVEGSPPRVIATLPAERAVELSAEPAVIDSPNGVLWIATRRPSTIERYELGTSAVYAFNARVHNGCADLFVIPNGVECVSYDMQTGLESTTITQYDTDGTMRWERQLRIRLGAVAATPDGRRTIVADDGAFTLLASDGTVVATFAASPRTPYSTIALSPDGTSLLAATQLGEVELWSLPP